MTLDALAGLLQASRFLPRGEPVEREALRALPELADGLPPVVLDARGPHVWSGAGEVVRAAAAGLPGQLAVAARTDPGPDAARGLAADPLVAAVSRLVVEGARHSAGAAVVPLLELVRCAHEAIAAEPSLGALYRADDGAGLRRVGAAVQARLAAACASASASVRVPALGWAVARSRLLPLFARGTLDRDPAWTTVAAVLDVPLPPGTMQTVEAAVRLAVRGVAERRTAGKTTADDAMLLLRWLGPARLDPGPESAAAALLHDPDGIAALLPAVARFVDAKALAGAGVDAGRAARLLTPDGGLALASVLTEILGALRTWDVLSQLAAAVEPGPMRGLVVPRAQPTRAAAVAVGLGRLRAEPGKAEAVDAAWDELARSAEGGLADGSVVAFLDAVDALRFALGVRRRLPTAAVGIAWGAVTGGTDGAVTRLSGPAVDSAARWVAGAPLPARTGEGEPGGLRNVGGWLGGQGLALETAAAEAIHDARVRRGLATAVDGPPGGDGRVPRSIDLHRAYDFDGAVLALARIPGVTGGFEALYLASDAWRTLLDRDGERAGAPVVPMSTPMEEPVAVAAQAIAEVEMDDGAGWEMSESDELEEAAPVTLDLAEHTSESYAPPAAPAGFEFDDNAGDTTAEEDVPFTGFYLPGAEAALARDAVRPPTTSPAASFDMLVEDDEEDTEEWGSGGTAPVPSIGPLPGPAARAPHLIDVSADAPVVSSDPFEDHEPFGDPFPVPDELRDPETPRSAPRLPASADPFSAFAEPPPDDPPSTDPFAGPSRPAGPPAEAFADPFANDPFASAAPAPPAPAPPAPAQTAPKGSPNAPSVEVRAPAGGSSGDPFSGIDTFVFAPPEAEGAPPRRGTGPEVHTERAPAAIDFDFLLKGYACFFERKEAVFGRPYGTRIVDRHVYPYSGDPDAAYTAFLQDKIREGFVPRADMMGDLPRGVTLMPLDPEKLQRAWQDLA